MRLYFNPKLLHLIGPFWINVYGVLIVIGIMFFVWASLRDPRRENLIARNLFFGFLSYSIVCGVIFARLLYVTENLDYFMQQPLKIFALSDGGLSLLGALIGVPITLIYKLKFHNIPIVPFFDLITTYIPALTAISRLGCFLAGCCHGCVAINHTMLLVTYTHPNSLALLNTPVYPTQLYSAATSFCFFIGLYFISKLKPPTGLIMSLFFMLEGFSRFFIDFWRGDRGEIVTFPQFLFLNISWYQLLALAIALFGFVGILCTILQKAYVSTER